MGRCVHYVGFRDDRYLNALRVFGRPAIIHRIWDQRAMRDIGEDDIVVFANGDEHQPISKFNGNDIDEEFLKPRRKPYLIAIRLLNYLEYGPPTTKKGKVFVHLETHLMQ